MKATTTDKTACVQRAGKNLTTLTETGAQLARSRGDNCRNVKTATSIAPPVIDEHEKGNCFIPDLKSAPNAPKLVT